MTNTRSRILWTLSAVIFIVVGTYIVVRFAQGYRPSRENLVAGNGLLVVNSDPKGARVLVNDRFLAATDDTLYLDPGEYAVEIQKDGYFPWKKTVTVDKEVVTQANALLFPTAPGLTPLSFSGAESPAPSPDGQKLVYSTASSSAKTKNGYYISELVDNQLAFQRGPRQITRSSSQFPENATELVWAPDSTQILLVSQQKAVLLDPNKLNVVEELPDITYQLPTIFSQWEQEMYQRDRERLVKFPVEMQRMATQSAVNVYFSPDEKRVMYTATAEFSLAENLLPAKPGSNTQPQTRSTKIGSIYVYDRDEDRQFIIGQDEQYLAWLKQNAKASPTPAPKKKTVATEDTPTLPLNPQKHLLATDLFRPQALTLEASPSAFTTLQSEELTETLSNFRNYHSPMYTHQYQWFPNSWHLVRHTSDGVYLQEYDGTNIVRIYSGPFDNTFVYPWPNGSRLIIRTNFNQGSNVPVNLYTVDLKQ